MTRVSKVVSPTVYVDAPVQNLPALYINLNLGQPKPAASQCKYPAKEHARKVVDELTAQSGIIYLRGQVTRTLEDSDQDREFRQRRYFFYLSGANFAGCHLTYDIAKDRLILWIPFNDPQHALWFGRIPSLGACRDEFDVDEVRYSADLEASLKEVIGDSRTLFVLHEQTPPLSENLREKLVVDHERLQSAIERARVIKTDFEVELLRRAHYISSEAHLEVLRRFKSLTNECEVEAIFRAVSLAHGAKRQAYPMIAGSGVNASTLHYVKNDEPLAGRQLMVLDAGCEWNCYASDITRTLPIGGKLTPEAKAVYDIVAQMQAVCLAGVKQGAIYYDLHVRAHLNAAAGLLRLGLLKGATPYELVGNGTSAAFFPHGLGHHVGLEVHDVTGRESLLYMPAFDKMTADCAAQSVAPTSGLVGKRQWFSPEMMRCLVREATLSQCLLPLRGHTLASGSQMADTRSPGWLSWVLGRRLLEKNMVITIEPGMYFCREYLEAYFKGNPQHNEYINWGLLEKYYPVGGVRIEDTVLVTETGMESLSTAPKGQEAIDIINAGSASTQPANNWSIGR